MNENERVGIQLSELTSRWLALTPPEQEAVLMVTRLMSDDRAQASSDDLPHYRNEFARMSHEWERGSDEGKAEHE